MADFSHFDGDGAPRMVAVGDKPVTSRMARASGRIRLASDVAAKVREGEIGKGDVLGVARLAGIMAVKETSRMIPLCHPLRLDGVDLHFAWISPTDLAIEATVQATEKTGVEMEALHAVTVAALTVYDMCKGLDRNAVISDIRLEEKSGGQSGHYLRSLDEEHGS